jgi:hypothetical protein
MATTTLRDWTGLDHVGAIMDYEGGEQSLEDSLRLFQYLVDTGLAWKLQGHYGRTATALIQKGLVAKSVHETPTHTLDDYR